MIPNQEMTLRHFIIPKSADLMHTLVQDGYDANLTGLEIAPVDIVLSLIHI